MNSTCAARTQSKRLSCQNPGALTINCPPSANDLAAALATIAMWLAEDPEAPTGIYHFSNSGSTTWYAIAREIFEQAGRRGGPCPNVVGIATADHVTAARGPANSRLSHTAITRDYGLDPGPWQLALSDILDGLVGTKPV